MKIHRPKLILLTVVYLLGMDCVIPAQSLRDWRRLAGEMVDEEVVAAGVKNERVIRAMRDTPRHEFVPANQRQFAYFDMALADRQRANDFAAVHRRVDDRGDRSAAGRPRARDRHRQRLSGGRAQPAGEGCVHDRNCRTAWPTSMRVLKRLDYKNVETRIGDGYQGWPEAAPFDKIIVTCSPEKVPQPLVDQLREGGLMVIPVGERYQQTLFLMRKSEGELKSEALRPTLFVPMTGEAEEKRRVKPDPNNPQITNGSFEELQKSDSGKPQPAGWHYQQQLTLKSDAQAAHDGKNFVEFHNTEPGRGCQALQGFAVDGRKVSAIQVSALGPRRKHSAWFSARSSAGDRRDFLRRSACGGRRGIGWAVRRHIRLAGTKWFASRPDSCPRGHPANWTTWVDWRIVAGPRPSAF